MWLRPHKGERVPHSRRRKRGGGFPSHSIPDRNYNYKLHGHGANSAAHVEIAFQRFNRFKRNKRALILSDWGLAVLLNGIPELHHVDGYQGCCFGSEAAAA